MTVSAELGAQLLERDDRRFGVRKDDSCFAGPFRSNLCTFDQEGRWQHRLGEGADVIDRQVRGFQSLAGSLIPNGKTDSSRFWREVRRGV